MRHEVHPVADAEDRQPPIYDATVDARRVRLVNTRRAAREDHAHDVLLPQLVRSDVVREDLAVDARLAYAARDQLRVLRAVVEDGDGRARRRRALRGPGSRRALAHQYW